jgi:hypothetical protein
VLLLVENKIGAQKPRKLKKRKTAWYRWLMPVILDTCGAEIRRLAVQSQPRQIV